MPHRREPPKNVGRPAKEVTCEECGKIITATEEHVRQGKSVCPECYKPKNGRRGNYGGYSKQPPSGESDKS